MYLFLCDLNEPESGVVRVAAKVYSWVIEQDAFFAGEILPFEVWSQSHVLFHRLHHFVSIDVRDR